MGKAVQLSGTKPCLRINMYLEESDLDYTQYLPSIVFHAASFLDDVEVLSDYLDAASRDETASHNIGYLV